MTAFVPSHRVPPSGMDSWPRPDAQAPQGPHLEGGLEVQVLERFGDWTRVAFSNGWTTWVDGRLLVSGTAGGPPKASTKPGTLDLQAIMADRPKAFAVGGAALIALSSILPWFRGGGSSNSFKVPMQFLFDYKSASHGGVKIGWLLLICAAAVVVGVVREADPRIAIGFGAASIVVAVLFVIQVQRFTSAANGTSLTDVVGFGVLPAAAGGVLVAFAPKLAAKRR